MMIGKCAEYRGRTRVAQPFRLTREAGTPHVGVSNARCNQAVSGESMPSSPPKPVLKVILCSPRGFCAGVVRAIESVERALSIYGAPVYVRHEIVHNKYVVDSLRKKGAIFVEELSEIPDDNVPVIFSAHGVPDRKSVV